MRNRFWVLMLWFCFWACETNPAFAGGVGHSRIRALFHGSEKFTDTLGAAVHFIPAGNLLGQVAPMGYLEFDWQATNWLSVGPCMGYAFDPDEVIVSLRLAPAVGLFWAWVDLEVRPQSWNGYWFVQAEIKISSFFHAGVETESWGTVSPWTGWSHGAGPNVLLRFGDHVGADIALHTRTNQDGKGNTKTELFVRVHLFF